MSGSADPKPASSRKPRRVPQAERDARLQFKRAVLTLDRECIAGPEECEGPLRAHHVLSQQQLRHAGLADSTWLADVGACVCERHHRRHHSRVEPIPRRRLPMRCEHFAHRHGLGYILDRYYS